MLLRFESPFKPRKDRSNHSSTEDFITGEGTSVLGLSNYSTDNCRLYSSVMTPLFIMLIDFGPYVEYAVVLLFTVEST